MILPEAVRPTVKDAESRDGDRGSNRELPPDGGINVGGRGIATGEVEDGSAATGPQTNGATVKKTASMSDRRVVIEHLFGVGKGSLQLPPTARQGRFWRDQRLNYGPTVALVYELPYVASPC